MSPSEDVQVVVVPMSSIILTQPRRWRHTAVHDHHPEQGSITPRPTDTSSSPGAADERTTVSDDTFDRVAASQPGGAFLMASVLEKHGIRFDFSRDYVGEPLRGPDSEKIAGEAAISLLSLADGDGVHDPRPSSASVRDSLDWEEMTKEVVHIANLCAAGGASDSEELFAVKADTVSNAVLHRALHNHRIFELQLEKAGGHDGSVSLDSCVFPAAKILRENREDAFHSNDVPFGTGDLYILVHGHATVMRHFLCSPSRPFTKPVSVIPSSTTGLQVAEFLAIASETNIRNGACRRVSEQHGDNLVDTTITLAEQMSAASRMLYLCCREKLPQGGTKVRNDVDSGVRAFFSPAQSLVSQFTGLLLPGCVSDSSRDRGHFEGLEGVLDEHVSRSIKRAFHGGCCEATTLPHADDISEAMLSMGTENERRSVMENAARLAERRCGFAQDEARSLLEIVGALVRRPVATLMLQTVSQSNPFMFTWDRLCPPGSSVSPKRFVLPSNDDFVSSVYLLLWISAASSMTKSATSNCGGVDKQTCGHLTSRILEPCHSIATGLRSFLRHVHLRMSLSVSPNSDAATDAVQSAPVGLVRRRQKTDRTRRTVEAKHVRSGIEDVRKAIVRMMRSCDTLDERVRVKMSRLSGGNGKTPATETLKLPCIALRSVLESPDRYGEHGELPSQLAVPFVAAVLGTMRAVTVNMDDIDRDVLRSMDEPPGGGPPPDTWKVCVQRFLTSVQHGGKQQNRHLQNVSKEDSRAAGTARELAPPRDVCNTNTTQHESSDPQSMRMDVVPPPISADTALAVGVSEADRVEHTVDEASRAVCSSEVAKMAHSAIESCGEVQWRIQRPAPDRQPRVSSFGLPVAFHFALLTAHSVVQRAKRLGSRTTDCSNEDVLCKAVIEEIKLCCVEFAGKIGWSDARMPQTGSTPATSLPPGDIRPASLYVELRKQGIFVSCGTGEDSCWLHIFENDVSSRDFFSIADAAYQCGRRGSGRLVSASLRTTDLFRSSCMCTTKDFESIEKAYGDTLRRMLRQEALEMFRLRVVLPEMQRVSSPRGEDPSTVCAPAFLGLWEKPSIACPLHAELASARIRNRFDPNAVPVSTPAVGRIRIPAGHSSDTVDGGATPGRSTLRARLYASVVVEAPNGHSNWVPPQEDGTRILGTDSSREFVCAVAVPDSYERQRTLQIVSRKRRAARHARDPSSFTVHLEGPHTVDVSSFCDNVDASRVTSVEDYLRLLVQDCCGPQDVRDAEGVTDRGHFPEGPEGRHLDEAAQGKNLAIRHGEFFIVRNDMIQLPVQEKLSVLGTTRENFEEEPAGGGSSDVVASLIEYKDLTYLNPVLTASLEVLQ